MHICPKTGSVPWNIICCRITLSTEFRIHDQKGSTIYINYSLHVYAIQYNVHIAITLDICCMPFLWPARVPPISGPSKNSNQYLYKSSIALLTVQLLSKNSLVWNDYLIILLDFSDSSYLLLITFIKHIDSNTLMIFWT